MRALSKCLIVLVAAWGSRAHAEEPDPQTPAADSQLSDEDLARMAESETIEIYDERPDKPFDRDTEVRLTGEELAARGAVDLATALDLLPDVSVRDVGRGGINVDIRGARKGAVSVLVDGALVSDPYYGTFDVSTIPITDIVQIRMSTSPQSPIDGPGGPGGVIEVLTRDAIGSQMVIARATSDTLPSVGVAGMARVSLGRHLALRMSASGIAGARDFDVPSGSLGENRHASSGAARLEYRKGDNRLALDGFVDDRHYVSPPSETSSILLIDRETTGRALAKGDIKRDKLQLQGQAFVQTLHRRSRNFMDAQLTVEQRSEELSALRVGGLALATRPIGKDARWVASTSIARDSGEDTAMGRTVRGEVSVLESAADLQYEKRALRLDGAAGVAVPLGVGADPWPEAKLVAKWRPQYGPIELTATGARKGRVPSLRERFDPNQGGNAAVGPEHATHAELRAVAEIKEQFRFELAPFYRRTTGTIRRSTDPADMMKLVNLGRLDFYGFDVSGRVYVHPRIAVGAAYDYIALGTCSEPPCTIDRLPAHRAEGWVEATPEPRITLHARVRYSSKFIDQMENLPGYTTVEATATATLSHQYLVVLRADDLLNVRPETHANYFGPGLVVTLVLQGQWE
ncbi:MAG TPA: TonB-dependent receptor plug domain-containing protein [Kofleriaceae bacterium]